MATFDAFHNTLSCYKCVQKRPCHVADEVDVARRDIEAARIETAYTDVPGMRDAMHTLHGLCYRWHQGQRSAAYAYLSGGGKYYACDAANEMLRIDRLSLKNVARHAMSTDELHACNMVIDVAEGTYDGEVL